MFFKNHFHLDDVMLMELKKIITKLWMQKTLA
jgi:hypothetical protein